MRLEMQWPASKLIDVVTAEGCRAHFGQFAEDSMLPDIFQYRMNGFYVDVGCHHPFVYSNTLLLHQVFGWRGINIDADIHAVRRFQAARPDDINLNVGIAETDGVRNFAVFNEGAVNTFDPALAIDQSKSFGEPRFVEVPIRRLSGILAEYLPADMPIGYMNVDCEGLDEVVLKSNNWNLFRPEIITVELHGFSLMRVDRNPVVQFLSAVGYELISFYWVTGLFRRIN